MSNQNNATLSHGGKKSISIVIPAFNEANNLQKLLPMIHELLLNSSYIWEILIVNDGSTDRTEQLLQDYASIQGFYALHFSRNFGKEAALSAGLEYAQGDAVITLDADLQHSPELIKKMLDYWENGAKVVYAARKNRIDETKVKRFFTKIFYNLVNMSNRFDLPKNASDFRLMDRSVINAILTLHERSRFMKALYAWVGFDSIAIVYEPEPRLIGKSSFNFLKLLHLAIDGITAVNTWPLRLISIIGFGLSAMSFIYGIFLGISYILKGHNISGWTTIMVSLLFFIGIQMISIGILGEYIARIFEEVKARPLFIIKQTDGVGLKNKL